MQLTARVKPIVVSMGSAAASGGYYIAAPATRIFANPLSITGSIGIFYGKADVSELLKKIGVSVEVYKTAPRADAESIFRPFTDEERRELERKVEQFYDMFLSRVAEGRKLTKQQVDAVGQGRVWTGEQAVERRLVDELGGLRQALATARRLAGMPEETPIVELPPSETTLLGRLLGIEGVSAKPDASASPADLRARPRRRAVRDLPGRPPARAHGNHAHRPVTGAPAVPGRGMLSAVEPRDEPLLVLERARILAGGAVGEPLTARGGATRVTLVGAVRPIFRLLARDATLASGDARLAGVPLHEAVSTGVAGLALCDPPLPGDWTPERYLLESARLAGFREAEARREVDQAVTRFELGAYARRRFADSYVAVKRVVLLAHATLGSPSVICAETPLAELDPERTRATWTPHSSARRTGGACSCRSRAPTTPSDRSSNARTGSSSRTAARSFARVRRASPSRRAAVTRQR